MDDWVRSYKNNGLDGLKEPHTWKRYSKETKLNALKDHLESNLSLDDCCEKHNISTTSVLRRWIFKYTSGKELKTTIGGFTCMKAGRKTTFEERLEIVMYALEHGKNYSATAKHYAVSYS